MRESKVEAAHVLVVDRHGGLSWKFVSPGLRGVPDRIDLLPVPEEHRALVARYVQFVELKAPGKTLRRQQELRRGELRDRGYAVLVVDSVRKELK